MGGVLVDPRAKTGDASAGGTDGDLVRAVALCVFKEGVCSAQRLPGAAAWGEFPHIVVSAERICSGRHGSLAQLFVVRLKREAGRAPSSRSARIRDRDYHGKAPCLRWISRGAGADAAALAI